MWKPIQSIISCQTCSNTPCVIDSLIYWRHFVSVQRYCHWNTELSVIRFNVKYWNETDDTFWVQNTNTLKMYILICVRKMFCWKPNQILYISNSSPGAVPASRERGIRKWLYLLPLKAFAWDDWEYFWEILLMFKEMILFVAS